MIFVANILVFVIYMALYRGVVKFLIASGLLCLSGEKVFQTLQILGSLLCEVYSCLI